MTKDEKINAMAKALKVLTLDPKIRNYLKKNDPKALEQAEDALYRDYDVLVDRPGTLFFKPISAPYKRDASGTLKVANRKGGM